MVEALPEHLTQHPDLLPFGQDGINFVVDDVLIQGQVVHLLLDFLDGFLMVVDVHFGLFFVLQNGLFPLLPVILEHSLLYYLYRVVNVYIFST